jgi:hypothetical protein
MTSPAAALLLDEAGLAFGGESVPVIERLLDELVLMIEDIRDRGLTLFRSSFVYDVEGTDGTPFYSVLFSIPSIDRDSRLAMSQALDRLSEWDDLLGLPPVADVESCGGGPVPFSPAIVRATQSDPNWLLGLATSTFTSLRGLCSVVVTAGSVPVNCFFVDCTERLAAWGRHWLRETQPDETGFQAIANVAYPHLDFADGLWAQGRRFHGGWSAVKYQMIEALAGLNDHAPTIFLESPTPGDIAARMSAVAGVNCSPESPSTHRNTSAMAERDVKFKGATLRCEWHVKFSPTVNRLHFRVLGQRVLVGIFVDHLTT